MDVPARYLTPEQREERLRALRGRLGREWLVHHAIDWTAIIVFAVFAVFVDTGLPIELLAVIGGLALGGFFYLWARWRIAPIQARIDELGQVGEPES